MDNTTETNVISAEGKLLRAEEVGHRLSLGRATVYALMASGELPTVRIGRAVRVPANRLADWIENRTNQGAR
jgi:excisionase family DNA binding protein